MEKETFMLQTTRTGRLPTNSVFTAEGQARAETERAEKSGEFEHIKLVQLLGAQRTTLHEIGRPPSAKEKAQRAKAAKSRGSGGGPKKQVTTAQLIGRISTLITLLLIGGVIFYAAEYVTSK